MNASTGTYDFRNPLNGFAALLMLVIAILGIMLNSTIPFLFAKFQSERTSFSLICLLRSVSNLIILIWAFLSTFLPITLSGTSPFSSSYESIVIITSNIIYTIVQVTGLLIAVNRCCAVFFPILYSKYFTFKVTIAILLVHLIYKSVTVALYIRLIGPGCYTLFSSRDIAWSPNYNEECHPSSTYSPANETAIFVGLVTAINVATFSKIYIFFKSRDMENGEIKMRTRRNRALFLQTVLQDANMLIDMFSTFQLRLVVSMFRTRTTFSLLSNERYWTFITGSLIWESVHSLDGLIMMLFNERLTFLKRAFLDTLGRGREDSSVIPVSRY